MCYKVFSNLIYRFDITCLCNLHWTTSFQNAAMSFSDHTPAVGLADENDMMIVRTNQLNSDSL